MRTPPRSLSCFLMLLLVLAGPLWAAVEIKEEPGKLVVRVQGEPFTEYVYQGAAHTYFYPVYGPRGIRLTREFPMAEVEGEEHDHPHHRSLWFAHGLVNGIDFWSEAASFANKPSKFPLGQIVHEKFLEVKGGEQAGVIRSLNRWEGPEGKVPLTSEQTVRIYDTPATARLIDFEEVLTAGPEGAILGDTKEGTMALRLNEALRLKPNKDGVGAGHILSSEGKTDDAVWGTRAAWVDYYGPVNGKQLGIAVFDHPSNPHYPTRWHARDYGLFAANPFANHEMDKTQPENSGELKLAPGEKATFKYRLYIHDGTPEQAETAHRYRDYVK